MAAPSAAQSVAPERGHPLEALLRRAVTVPTVLVLFALGLASAPLWVPAALLVDLAFRGRRAAFRCGAFLLWYLACETGGLVLILATNALRLRGHEAFIDANTRLQHLFAKALFRGAQLTFGIRLEVEGADALGRGPVLLLVRHATVVDTLAVDAAWFGSWSPAARRSWPPD